MKAFLQKHLYATVGVSVLIGMIVRGLIFYHGLPQ